jgi:pimeloyl-ACP methyl ester carboxylesterase
VRQEHLKVPFGNTFLDVAACLEKSGPDWLFCIHGVQSNSQLFGDLFSQSFLKGYSKIAIDLVGFGQSAKPHGFSYSVEDQAAVVREVFGLLEIERAVLVGHSLGGMIGVLLLDPLSEVLRGFVNMEGNLQYADCGASKEVANSDYASFRADVYRDIKTKVAGESPQRTLWLNDIPDYVFYKSSQSIVEWSKSEKLAPLFASARCPSLFVYGERNSYKRLAVPKVIPSCQINNAGHFMLMDNPQESYACLESFLTSQPYSDNQARS